MRYLLLFFTITFHGQVLHHQMISSQGMSKKMRGLIVSQTIGQQSIVGSSSKDYVIVQGFQQSVWGKFISSNIIDDIKTTTYPNPFVETVRFEFSKPILELITVNVFDLSGHLVFEEKKNSMNNILTIDLPGLPSSEYLVRLTAPNFNYYAKIIKL